MAVGTTLGIPMSTDGTLGGASPSTVIVPTQSAVKTYADAGYRPSGTDVAVADGGTGASTAAGARSNLGALAAAATVQTVSAATDTVGSATDVVKVTHASPTITLPTLASTTRPVIFVGPAMAAGVTPYAVIVRAGSDPIETGATGVRVDGPNYVLTAVPDGAAWRITCERGVAQVPVGHLDVTAASGGTPWSLTDGVNGSTVTVTDRSTSGTITASSGLVLNPAASSAIWSGNTGTGISADLTSWGLRPSDSYAVLAKCTIDAWTNTNDSWAVFAGTTIAAVPKTGAAWVYSGGVKTASVRWTTVSATISTDATADALGYYFDGRHRAIHPLGGTWSGTFQSTLFPMSYAKLGGVDKRMTDPNDATASAVDWASLSRALVGATNQTDGRTYTVQTMIVVKLLFGADQ